MVSPKFTGESVFEAAGRLFSVDRFGVSGGIHLASNAPGSVSPRFAP